MAYPYLWYQFTGYCCRLHDVGVLNEADAKRVQTVYLQLYQSCHGAERQGAVGPALKQLGEHMK